MTKRRFSASAAMHVVFVAVLNGVSLLCVNGCTGGKEGVEALREAESPPSVAEVVRLVGPGTAKVEVRRRVARYEDASYEVLVTPSQFLPGGRAWLRDGTRVFLVFDRSEQQVKEVHVSDRAVHVGHGIGAGSTFKAVREAYPEAEVRTLAGYGTEVEVAPGVVVLFGERWEDELPEDATVSAIVLRAGAGDGGSLRAPSGRNKQRREGEAGRASSRG